MEAAGATEGIDIVMDSVQGPYFEPCFQKLARGGRHIVFGTLRPTAILTAVCVRERLSVCV